MRRFGPALLGGLLVSLLLAGCGDAVASMCLSRAVTAAMSTVMLPFLEDCDSS